MVLAHPVKIKDEIIEDILELDFHGIEAVYFKNTEEETKCFKRIAMEKDWFYTAGSDFHTDKRIDNRHGKIGDVYLNKEEIEKFIKR